MPTHRYPMPDGREVEIIDPIREGRARIYLQGELLGEYTIHELKWPAKVVLPDGSQILVHVVATVPFFRSFDVRLNGVALPRSAGDAAWSRRTVIDLLLLSAFTHIRFHLVPLRWALETGTDYIHAIFIAMAVLTAVAVWKRVYKAGTAAQAFMFLQCAYASFTWGEILSINIDLETLALYAWMRHAAAAMDEPRIEYTPRPTPATTLT